MVQLVLISSAVRPAACKAKASFMRNNRMSGSHQFFQLVPLHFKTGAV
jgi:hypothetical protein